LADSGAPLNTTPLIFHSEPMMTAINHARALAEDGVFGDTGRDAWRLGGDEMRRYSVREIPTTWEVPIRLGLKEAELARADRLAKELEELLPGRFKALEARKQESLSAEQRAALAVPAMDRSEEQQQTVATAEAALKVTWPMVAREAPADVKAKAQELARQFVEANETAEIIGRYRDIVNFDFWRATCEAEVTDEMLTAREATWRAERDFENARLQAAKKAYEEAFAAWRKVLDSSEVLRKDSLTADDIKELVDRYRKVLEQLDEPFPKPFILQDVLE
jgi:hypothetical protein